MLNHDLRPSQVFTPAMGVRATARAIRGQPNHTAATLKEFLASAKQNLKQARLKRKRPPGMTNAARQKRTNTRQHPNDQL